MASIKTEDCKVSWSQFCSLLHVVAYHQKFDMPCAKPNIPTSFVSFTVRTDSSVASITLQSCIVQGYFGD